MKDPQVAAQKLNSQINLSASKPEKPSITQNSTLYSFKVKWSLANNATCAKSFKKFYLKQIKKNSADYMKCFIIRWLTFMK